MLDLDLCADVVCYYKLKVIIKSLKLRITGKLEERNCSCTKLRVVTRYAIRSTV